MPEKSTHSTSTSTSTGSGSGSSNSSVFGKCRPVSSFQKIGRIGEGTYGTVYKALDKDTKKIVALKRIIMHNEKHDGFPLTSIREIDTLRRTDHPNCVKMLDVVVGHKRDGVFLVFEYCEHDISALLDKVRTPFSESEIKSLVFQLLSAVAYLHEHWIIHRDIKLSNLLYNNKGEVKLADFGLARTFPSHCPAKAQGDLKSNIGGGGQGFVRPKYTTDVRMTLKVVTLWYRAPELLLGSDSYTTAIDVWAVGCVLGELLLGRPLLPGDTELDQIHRIFELLGCPSSRIWTDLPALKAFSSNSNCRKSNSLPYSLNLYEEQKKYPFSNLQAMFPSPSRIGDNGLECLNSMLTFDPKRRITARESLRHIYFSSSPYPKESDMMPTFPSQHDDFEEGSSDNIQLQSGAHSGREREEGDFSNSSHKVVDRRGNESRGSSSLGSFASALATSYSSTTKSRLSGSNSNKYRYSDSDHRHRASSGHHKRSDRGSSVSVESNNRKRYRDAT